MPEQAATARHELGLFYKSIGRVSEAVEHQERVVEYRRSQTAQPAQLADALLDLAAYLQTCGSAERAIVVIDEADDLLTRHGSDVARATSVYIRGVTYATVGDIAEGEALLARAARMFDAAGQPERGRSVRTDLGGRMVSRGDRAGLALLESFVGIHTGTSEASRRSTATGYFNLGIGYAAFGEDEQASQSFLLARAEYLSLGDPRAVAGCDHNLAALAFRSGRHDDARAVYQRLVDESRTPPVDGDRLASALAALGKVCRDQRDFEPALAAYREARSLYFAGGRLADTADCDIQLAAINGSLGASHLEVAADMLPAAVFIDARRHQFPDAQQRGAWSRLAVNSEWAFGRMLESAHRSGDARLVAELIEFLINSGVHSADGVSDAPSDTGVWPHDEPVSDVVDEPESSEGALRLIVGARLPMTPAPRLAWHTGELVLSPYVEESAVRYAPVLRPPTVTLDLPSSL
nr:tetratricopeptide repeat protein [Mycolicibacterium sp. BK634]